MAKSIEQLKKDVPKDELATVVEDVTRKQTLKEIIEIMQDRLSRLQKEQHESSSKRRKGRIQELNSWISKLQDKLNDYE